MMIIMIMISIIWYLREPGSEIKKIQSRLTYTDLTRGETRVNHERMKERRMKDLVCRSGTGHSD